MAGNGPLMTYKDYEKVIEQPKGKNSICNYCRVNLSNYSINLSHFQPPRRSIICPWCRTARPGGAASRATPSPSSITRRSGVMLWHEIMLIMWCQKEPEPEHLLLVTRTRTDARGRRHSVAVPMLPPPDGEKFAGGYSIQRNPITGGARLLPPPAPGQL